MPRNQACRAAASGSSPRSSAAWIGRADDQKDRAERARRVEAQRHRGHVGPAGPPGQAEGHDRVDQVADHDADGRPGDHPGQDERPGQAEAADEQAGHQDHVADVVEHQPKKALMSPRRAQA